MMKFQFKMSVLIAVVSVCLAVVAPEQALAGTPRPRSWAVQPTPLNDAVTLTAVSCKTGKFCVAVGTFEFGSNGAERPAAYSWDGIKWSALPVPADASALQGIACVSVGLCIAVGDNSESSAQAWSWKDGGWIDEPTYSQPGGDLSAVRCATATSCEAVGQHGNALVTYPMAEYWNGSTWTDQSIPASVTGSLHAVACQSIRHCEGVGTNNLADAVLAMSLSQSSWSVQTTPRLPAQGEGYELTGVSCYVSGCTAVGNSEAGTTVAEAWTGRTWTLVSPVGTGDPSGSNSAWNGIHCLGASYCMAVGGSASGEGNGFRTMVDTWNGTTWMVNKTPNPSLYGDQLFAISCTRVCTAVGYQGVANIQESNSLVLRSGFAR